MKCSECGKYLIVDGRCRIDTGRVLEKYEISEYHYITGEGKRLCEECFNLWWYGKSFKKNKEICELRRKIKNLELEMRKDAV